MVPRLLASVGAAMLLGGCAVVPSFRAAQEQLARGNLLQAHVDAECAEAEAGTDRGPAIGNFIDSLDERISRWRLEEAKRVAAAGKRERAWWMVADLISDFIPFRLRVARDREYIRPVASALVEFAPGAFDELEREWKAGHRIRALTHGQALVETWSGAWFCEKSCAEIEPYRRRLKAWQATLPTGPDDPVVARVWSKLGLLSSSVKPPDDATVADALRPRLVPGAGPCEATSALLARAFRGGGTGQTVELVLSRCGELKVQGVAHSVGVQSGVNTTYRRESRSLTTGGYGWEIRSTWTEDVVASQTPIYDYHTEVIHEARLDVAGEAVVRLPTNVANAHFTLTSLEMRKFPLDKQPTAEESAAMFDVAARASAWQYEDAVSQALVRSHVMAGSAASVPEERERHFVRAAMFWPENSRKAIASLAKTYDISEIELTAFFRRGRIPRPYPTLRNEYPHPPTLIPGDDPKVPFEPRPELLKEEQYCRDYLDVKDLPPQFRFFPGATNCGDVADQLYQHGRRGRAYAVLESLCLKANSLGACKDALTDAIRYREYVENKPQYAWGYELARAERAARIEAFVRRYK